MFLKFQLKKSSIRVGLTRCAFHHEGSRCCLVLVSVSVPSSYRWPSVLHPLSHQGAEPFKTGRSVEVTVLQDHGSIGSGRICIIGYDPPYACACFRRYKPLRDASQSLTECPRVYFYVTSWSGTPRHFSR